MTRGNTVVQEQASAIGSFIRLKNKTCKKPLLCGFSWPALTISYPVLSSTRLAHAKAPGNAVASRFTLPMPALRRLHPLCWTWFY